MIIFSIRNLRLHCGRVFKFGQKFLNLIVQAIGCCDVGNLGPSSGANCKVHGTSDIRRQSHSNLPAAIICSFNNPSQLHAICQSKDGAHGMTKDKRSGKSDKLSTGSEESSTSKIPHDKFFRAIFKHTRYCIGLFPLAVTEAEFKAFDWRTLSNDADLVFTSNWSERKPDLVVSVNWKRSGKRLKLLNFLCEFLIAKWLRRVNHINFNWNFTCHSHQLRPYSLET